MEKLSQKEIAERLESLEGDWELVGEDTLLQTYTFVDFKQAMEFVNAIARVAQEEKHHPGIFIDYNAVTLELKTHDIEGLSEKDFHLAEKINDISVW